MLIKAMQNKSVVGWEIHSFLHKWLHVWTNGVSVSQVQKHSSGLPTLEPGQTIMLEKYLN